MKEKKRVMILGASRYFLGSILTSKRLGYHTIVIDKNPDAYSYDYADEYAVIDIVGHLAVLDYAREKKIDGIVALNDFGVYTAAFVSTKLNLPGISTDIAETVTNKAKMRLKWQETNQPNPEFRIADSFEKCKRGCNEIGYPVILKPAISGGGSRGVIVVYNDAELNDANDFATSFYSDNTILVEELLNGFEHSSEVLVQDGKGVVLAISDKIKTPYPARVDKNVIYPTIFEGEHRKKLEKVILDAALAMGIENGCAHVECCTLPSGVIKLFELGARPGGGGTPDPIVTQVTGINEIEEYLKICVGEKIGNLKIGFERGCSFHFLTPEPGIIQELEGVENIKDIPGVLDAEFFLNEGDEIKEVKTGSDRSGFIITAGENREEALKLGYNIENTIKIKYKN